MESLAGSADVKFIRRAAKALTNTGLVNSEGDATHGASLARSTFAVTGGTGKYRNVRGSMDLKYRNPQGTEFDFIFHLIG